MSSFPLYAMSVASQLNTSLSGGGSSVGFSFATSDYVKTIGSATGGVDDGSAYFVAEYDTIIASRVAWVAISGESDSDGHNRWQLTELSLISDDGLSEFPLPVRPLVKQPDTAETHVARGFLTPRVSKAIDGQSVADIDELHGPVVIRARFEIEKYDSADASAVGGDDVRITNVLAQIGNYSEPEADYTKIDADWAPGLEITQKTGFPVPRSAHVRLSSPASEHGEIDSVLLLPSAGKITYQAPFTLQAGTAYDLSVTTNFDSFAGRAQTEVYTETITPTGGGVNPASGPYVDLYYDYSIFLTAASQYTSWQGAYTEGTVAEKDYRTIPNNGGSAGGYAPGAALGQAVDYPPLNTPLSYRALIGNYTAPVPPARSTGLVVDDIVITHAAIESSEWVLTDATAGIHLVLTAASVSETRDSTTTTMSGPTGQHVVRGSMVGPAFQVSGVRLRTTAERQALEQMLQSTKLIIRGPHGQREYATLTGGLNVVSSEAATNLGDTNTALRGVHSSIPAGRPQNSLLASNAPVAYLPTASFTLSTDTSHPSLSAPVYGAQARL
jgi:hypothetical protein